MEIIYGAGGMVLFLVFAILAMYFFVEVSSPVLGTLSGIISVAVLLGGFYLADQQFEKDCIAAGGHMIMDSCYGLPYGDFELEYDDD